MKYMSRVIRSAIIEKKDWRQVLNQFLRSYRSTSHRTTGVPPATLLYGENRTIRLLAISDNEVCSSDIRQQARENDKESKAQ